MIQSIQASPASDTPNEDRPVGTDGRGPRWPVVAWSVIWVLWIGFLLVMLIGKPG